MSERMFPIMNGPSVPWSVMAPHEKQAIKNHGQTLQRLSERGGLGAEEAWFIVNDQEWPRLNEPRQEYSEILPFHKRWMGLSLLWGMACLLQPRLILPLVEQRRHAANQGGEEPKGRRAAYGFVRSRIRPNHHGRRSNEPQSLRRLLLHPRLRGHGASGHPGNSADQ